MPTSGPHPDSKALAQKSFNVLAKASSEEIDVEDDTPIHRHIVVFSYSVLRSFLKIVGFRDIKGCGFGYYPFPKVTQPIFERIDPWHCHQMVFVARK